MSKILADLSETSFVSKFADHPLLQMKSGTAVVSEFADHPLMLLAKSVETSKSQSYDEAFTLYPNNKAAQMRYLFSQGYSVGATHKIMVAQYGKFLYQHVYNTSKRELKKS